MNLVDTIQKVAKDHRNSKNISVRGDSVNVKDRYGNTVYVEFLSDETALVNGKRHERGFVHTQDHSSEEQIVRKEGLAHFVAKIIERAFSFQDWHNYKRN